MSSFRAEKVTRGVAVSVEWPHKISNRVREKVIPHLTDLIETAERIAHENPTIVCLCGSTRFKREFIAANFRESMAGKIVLSVGWFSHADGEFYAPTPEEKALLDEVYFRKIELADEVLILNVGGYIGESTGRELEHARKLGKVVRFLEPEERSDPDDS